MPATLQASAATMQRTTMEGAFHSRSQPAPALAAMKVIEPHRRTRP